MVIDLLSESCEERVISLLGNEDEPIFREHVLPDQPEFLVIFYELLRQTHWIRNASILLAMFGNGRQEIIAIIIKHHTYTHCTFRLYIHTRKLSSIFP